MDNVRNDDTLFEAISASLQQEDNVRYSPVEYQKKCVGHIVDL